ncbi:THUMP-like domain-containing protein [Bacteroides uniformis]|uniref:THUMP-like domain-containing protein n=1 Tax=Bacteroides uniformis TaxID=820 RepID=UPI0011074234|nr:SAM-dependent methyltransferase [Bacteroides uniformis]MDC1840033.1 SAM-dependent methyltransferase [Bacteroides uniformis]MDC1865958.1 SAM-dependent methyltransferase [Bacteroides uniformis]MDC1870196.1 SAM-dependent methyltransferase [Bacteroides uniformis]
MPLSPDTLRFIREHRRDDVRSLALQARRYPSVDMPAAITQISGRQIAKEKIPAWAGNENILYPAHLSLEQCSSQVTAQYKAEIIGNLPRTRQEHPAKAGTFTDLTGGFGIDCAFLSSRFGHATYVERQEALCRIAAHNFPALGLNHISVCHADSVRHLQEMEPVDCIFIDPARRDGHGGKTVAIGDCEPDVSALEELLLRKARHVLVKLSPMLDLTLALNDLKHVREAHIVSVGNECKELLLLLGQGETLPTDDIPIHCVNFTSAPAPQALVFTRGQEKECACPYTPLLKPYLYEPNASVLKAGAFRSLSSLYKIEKLHPNSHLYTSDSLLPDFPGRKFRITSSCGFGKKEVKEMLAAEKKANLTVRNFPATVAELRKRLKLAEGGDTYLFATTLADGKKVLIRCQATG